MIAIKRAAVFILLCFSGLVIWMFTGDKVDNAAENYAQQILINNASQTLSEFLYQELSNFDMSEIISETGTNGITVLSVDSATANQIALSLVASANKKLYDGDFCTINLPLGNILGSKLLSGTGPEISIKTVPVGYAVGNLYSSMTSAGINQTNYRLIASISAGVGLMYPFDKCVCDLQIDIIICERIIIGSVPEIIGGEFTRNLE